MNIRVYQINKGRDVQQAKFIGLAALARMTGSSLPDPRIYDEVFRGEVTEKNLEEVFVRFNTKPHGLHRGHSLSVSDLIIVSGSGIEQDGAYFCDLIGWKKTSFDPALTEKGPGLHRIVMLEPGLPAYETYIPDEFRDMQRAVEGFVEITYPFDDSACAVGNDEAKLIGMEGNRMIGGGLYAGPVIIIGSDEGEGGFISLTNDQVERYLNEFKEPEYYTKEEVEGSTRFCFIAFN